MDQLRRAMIDECQYQMDQAALDGSWIGNAIHSHCADVLNRILKENGEGEESATGLRWYTFRQNNSGGTMTGPAHMVVVEAHSGDEANARAKQVGVYFDGVTKNIDCECCGDRWYTVFGEDEGDALPSIWGEPIEFGTDYTLRSTIENVTLKALRVCGRNTPQILLFSYDGVMELWD